MIFSRIAPLARDPTVAKRDESAGRLPASTTIRLSRELFEDVYWICRVEGKSPGDLIREVCGPSLASRRKRYEPQIDKLKRLDEQTARVEAEARERAG